MAVETLHPTILSDILRSSATVPQYIDLHSILTDTLVNPATILPWIHKLQRVAISNYSEFYDTVLPNKLAFNILFENVTHVRLCGGRPDMLDNVIHQLEKSRVWKWGELHGISFHSPFGMVPHASTFASLQRQQVRFVDIVFNAEISHLPLIHMLTVRLSGIIKPMVIDFAMKGDIDTALPSVRIDHHRTDWRSYGHAVVHLHRVDRAYVQLVGDCLWYCKVMLTRDIFTIQIVRPPQMSESEARSVVSIWKRTLLSHVTHISSTVV